MKFTIDFRNFLAGVYFSVLLFSIDSIVKRRCWLWHYPYDDKCGWGITLMMINVVGLFFNSFVMVKK